MNDPERFHSPDDAQRDTPQPDEVTSVITHHVKPGAKAQYEAWLREITPAAQRFPGHRGVNIIRPPADTGAYTIVLHFDTLAHAQAWLSSDTRRTLIAQVEPLLLDGDQVEIKTGLEFWFTPPTVQQRARPHKQFLLTLSVIFPLTMLVPWVLQPLFLVAPTLGLPGIRHLLVSAIIVGLMTSVIMPRYTRVMAGWLYGNANAAPHDAARTLETRTSATDRSQP